MDAHELKVEASKIQWFHTMELPHGIVTSGVESPADRLPRLGIPEDLHGKTVLDVGAWDGFFSFECERRGARRVLATDSFCWGGPGWGSKAGFELARLALGSQVEDQEIDVLEHSPETVGVFDVVLFLGVLYHVRHPLLALERIASVTRELLILDTHVDLMRVRRPAMAFYPGSEVAGDPTNWWGPNPRAIDAMLRTVGFRSVRLHSLFPSSLGRMVRAARHAVRRSERFSEVLVQGRAVFHARK
jgi:tRNA (mo5U34)-methyltransferase